MSELPTPISDQDKLLSNIAIGTPDIEDLIPNSRQEIYLKYIALNGKQGTYESPVSIENGGTGATTATEARTNLDVWKEYSLYSNSSGTIGTITLSDTYTNYKKILVYYADNGVYNTATLYPDTGSKLALSTAYLNTDGNGWFLHSTLVSFSGKSVSFSRNGLAYHNDNKSITVTLSGEAGIYVYKVVGYKY